LLVVHAGCVVISARIAGVRSSVPAALTFAAVGLALAASTLIMSYRLSAVLERAHTHGGKK
jgi:hypothetical protein